jgi:hypothetical protein
VWPRTEGDPYEAFGERGKDLMLRNKPLAEKPFPITLDAESRMSDIDATAPIALLSFVPPQVA